MEFSQDCAMVMTFQTLGMSLRNVLMRNKLVTSDTSGESIFYRSLVMKVAFVARDRFDMAEAMKFLERHMKEPRSGHMQGLNRLCQCLVKINRWVLTYARQTSDETLQVHMDSDWAGGLLERKSTTGVIVRRRKHLLRHMSCLQTLVALSSEEDKYCALVLVVCTSLGIQLPRLDD